MEMKSNGGQRSEDDDELGQKQGVGEGGGGGGVWKVSFDCVHVSAK